MNAYGRLAEGIAVAEKAHRALGCEGLADDIRGLAQRVAASRAGVEAGIARDFATALTGRFA